MNTQKYIINKFNNKLFVKDAITIGHFKEDSGLHHSRHLTVNQLGRLGALPFYVFDKQRLFLNYLFKHHTFLKIQDQRDQSDMLPFHFAHVTKKFTVISETQAGCNKLKKIFSKSIFENNINVLYFHNTYMPAGRVLYADSDNLRKIRKENFCDRPKWLVEASAPEDETGQNGGLTPVLTLSMHRRTFDNAVVPTSVDNFFNVFNSNFLFLSSGATRRDNILFELSQ